MPVRTSGSLIDSSTPVVRTQKKAPEGAFLLHRKNYLRAL